MATTAILVNTHEPENQFEPFPRGCQSMRQNKMFKSPFGFPHTHIRFDFLYISCNHWFWSVFISFQYTHAGTGGGAGSGTSTLQGRLGTIPISRVHRHSIHVYVLSSAGHLSMSCKAKIQSIHKVI